MRGNYFWTHYPTRNLQPLIAQIFKTSFLRNCTRMYHGCFVMGRQFFSYCIFRQPLWVCLRKSKIFGYVQLSLFENASSFLTQNHPFLPNIFDIVTSICVFLNFTVCYGVQIDFSKNQNKFRSFFCHSHKFLTVATIFSFFCDFNCKMKIKLRLL